MTHKHQWVVIDRHKVASGWYVTRCCECGKTFEKFEPRSRFDR